MHDKLLGFAEEGGNASTCNWHSIGHGTVPLTEQVSSLLRLEFKVA